MPTEVPEMVFFDEIRVVHFNCNNVFLMKLKISNPYYHILFWLAVITILTLIFGRSWGSGAKAFYFISLMLPVVMGTSYFFNYYLVPKFLLNKKYFWFGLYTFYTLVISLYLQMLVLVFSYVYLANFSWEVMDPNSRDTILLAFVMYSIVFFGSFLVMFQQLSERQREIEHFRSEKEKLEKQFLELISNRQLVRIPYDEIVYIESLSDYIKVHSLKVGEITSKEKISVLSEKLPAQFIRIHRSFIVNKDKITRFNANEIELNEIQLNIGRSFKKQVLPVLKSI